MNPWQVLLVEMSLHRTKAEQVARIADELLSLGETPASFLGQLKAAGTEIGLARPSLALRQPCIRGGIRQ